MKQSAWFGCLLLLVACASHKEIIELPPDNKINNFDTSLQNRDNGWFYKGKPFSGYMIQSELDGRVVYQLPIIRGKENGIAIGWYNTGEKLMERNFVNGKKEGLCKQWWPNGNIRYLLNYKNDGYDGKELAFFPDGMKEQESNYKDGKEEGLQSIWNKDGQLISNYTIRNNKLYGVINVKSCLPGAH